MLCLIHPNVAVMWNKVQCRICAIWCDATRDVKNRCNVECVRYGAMQQVMCSVRGGVVKCDAMWDDGVVHGEYGGVLRYKM